MIETTLNPAYPSMHAITSYIVATAVSSTIKYGYANPGTETVLVDIVQQVFEQYEWEPDTDGPRLQVMRELEFIGFAW